MEKLKQEAEKELEKAGLSNEVIAKLFPIKYLQAIGPPIHSYKKNYSVYLGTIDCFI